MKGDGTAAWSHGDTTVSQIEFDKQLSSSNIKITIRDHNWFCPATSAVGQLLVRQPEGLSFKHFGKQLAIFQLSVVPKSSDSFSSDVSDDVEGSLKVEKVSSGIWFISGTRIYQVEGDEHALVVHTPQYLRLYDMDGDAIRWEKYRRKSLSLPHDEIFCLVKDYVIMDHGKYYLLQRSNGAEYGKFDTPNVGRRDHRECFGPFVSSEGLILFRPSAKFLYIFRVGKKKVEFRIWEAEARVQGSIVLRGELDELEWYLVDQDNVMKEHRRCAEKIHTRGLVLRILDK